MTDKALAALPITQRMRWRSLREAGLDAAVFSDVRSNPDRENLEAGVAAFRAGGMTA